MGPRQDLVRRLVLRRLPPGSLVVDAAWRPGSPLGSLVPHYAAVAVAGHRHDRPPGTAVRAGLGRLPFASSSVDGVLLLDVLERLDDDRAALDEAARALRSGGLVLAATPAGPRLWSAHDEVAGHRRRYTPRELVGLATGVGLVPEQVHRFQCLLYPLFAANRRRARRRPAALELERRPPPWLGRALHAVNQAEVVGSRRLPWPWGTSLLLAARKP
jgi:SAM-dependent methyltransferase